MSGTEERYRRADALFAAASDRPAAERSAFVEHESGGDEALRAEVEALLAARFSGLDWVDDAIRSAAAELAERPDPFVTAGRIGRYEQIELLGEGGFGVVYRARDPVLERGVAIKTCTSGDLKVRRRFLREAKIAASLRHTNIVTVHDIGVEQGMPYLVQELLGGEDLTATIERRDAGSPRRRLRILLDAARGLEHAHRHGVVHRDIKPGNLRLLEDGQLKVLDFGIARLVEERSDLTSQGVALGTVGYLAPEMLRGERFGPRGDLFALGVVAFELFAEQHPFPGATFSQYSYRLLHEAPPRLRELAPAISDELAGAIDRCLELDPERRFAHAGELARALERTPEHAPETADSLGPSRPEPRGTRIPRRAPVAAEVGLATQKLPPRIGRVGATGLALLGAAALGVAAIGLGRSAERRPDPAGTAATANPSVQQSTVEPPSARRSLGAPADLRRASTVGTPHEAAPPVENFGANSNAPQPADASSGNRTAEGVSPPPVASSPGSAPAREPAVRDSVSTPVVPGDGDRSTGDPSRADPEPTPSTANLLVDAATGSPSTQSQPSDPAPASPFDVSQSAAGPETERGPSEPWIVRGEAGVVEPSVVRRVEAKYPERAHRLGATATVVLGVLVDAQGRVTRVVVQASDDPGLGFNEAARQAAVETRFDPARRNGVAGKMWTSLTFRFNRP